MQKRNVMKKLFIFIIILAVVALFAKVTVPTPEKHQEVAKVKLNELIKGKLSTLKGVAEMIEGDRMQESMYLEFALKGLEMKDYFVCNAGFLEYDGKKYMITLGMFNHVFVTTDYIDEIKKINEKADEIKEKFE